MQKLFIIIGTLLFSIYAQAFEVGASAGEFTIRNMNPEMESLNWTILKLYDTDKSYPPSVALHFYSDDETIAYSIGIIKTDGKQGLSAYIAKGSPQNREKQNAVKTNLSLGAPYNFSYEYTEGKRVILVVAGKKITSRVGFLPTKVQLMVSGMEVQLAPALTSKGIRRDKAAPML